MATEAASSSRFGVGSRRAFGPAPGPASMALGPSPGHANTRGAHPDRSPPSRTGRAAGGAAVGRARVPEELMHARGVTILRHCPPPAARGGPPAAARSRPGAPGSLPATGLDFHKEQRPALVANMRPAARSKEEEDAISSGARSLSHCAAAAPSP